MSEYTQELFDQDTKFARSTWEAYVGETKSFDRWHAEVAAAALEEFAEKWATTDGLEALLPVSDDVEAVRAMERALLERARTYRRNEGEN